MDIDKEIATCYSLIEEIEAKVETLKTQFGKFNVGLSKQTDGVYLSKGEYDKLLEYKYMYRDLCE